MDKKLTSNRICVYLAEGECEEKLLNALKQKPAQISPGRVKKFNVVQNELKASHLMSFPSGSNVVLVFDTDVEETECLKKNIELLKSQFGKVEITTIPQYLNFEQEMERCTDVIKAPDLTKNSTVSDFKRAVNRMKDADFRGLLKRHKFDKTKLWIKNPPKAFSFVKQQSDQIKL